MTGQLVPGRPEFDQLRQETAIQMQELNARHEREHYQFMLDYYVQLSTAGCTEDELGVEWTALVHLAIPAKRDPDDRPEGRD